MTSHDRTRPQRAGVTGARLPFRPGVLALAALLVVLPGAACAQGVDCADLRARLEAARRGGDAAGIEAALRQRRDEIDRVRRSAEDGGCTGTGIFDDPDSDQCRALARRVEQMEAGLRRLQDGAARGDPAADDRRRALTEQVEAECPAEADLPPDGTMPVDPDAAPGEGTPAPSARFARVLCVRRCDGAFYPLAVDVAAERLGDMDRVCQAQCPAAEASAFGSGEEEDVSGAVTSDGTAYSALATAFKFRAGTSPQCACRAPHQSWTEALAGAEALLEPHKGDVTVTPALAASMARPIAPPPAGKTPAPRKTASPAKPPKKPDPLRAIPVPDIDPGRDLTRAFRRFDPTL